MLSSCKELAEKSLANHIFSDGGRMKGGIDVHKLDFRPGVGTFGPLLGFNPLGPSEWRCWAKIHGTPQ